MKTMPKVSLNQPPIENLIKSYSRYHYWANKILIDWIREESVCESQQLHSVSFSEVDLALRTVLHSQEFWLRIIKNEQCNRVDPPENSIIEAYDELPFYELMDGVVSISLQFSNYVSALNQNDLERKLHLKSPWFESFQRRFELILHVVNHAAFHRGQISSMGRSLGYNNVPMMDYNYFMLNVN